MHKGYCIKIANFVHPLQVGVARFKAIDVRVASSFCSQVKTQSITKVCLSERTEVSIICHYLQTHPKGCICRQ